jgi:hypothetical protein
MTVFELQKRRSKGVKCVVESNKIWFKRSIDNVDAVVDTQKHSEIPPVIETTDQQTKHEDDCEADVRKLVKKVLDIIKETGRGDDFLSVTKAIESGALPVEKHRTATLSRRRPVFVCPNYSHRYNQVGVDFWTVVKEVV